MEEPWRFWTKVDKSGECWRWKGAVTTNGYGSCTNYLAPAAERRTIHAHRLSLLIASVAMPAGLQVDHLCRNKLCVRPDHMEMVTQAENLRRRDWGPTCINGHPWEHETTHVRTNGQRVCRPCMAAAARRFRGRAKLRTAALAIR